MTAEANIATSGNRTSKLPPRRYLFFAAVAFASGTALARFSELEPAALFLAAAGLAAILAVSALAREPRALAISALCLAALAGAANYTVRSLHPACDEPGVLLNIDKTGPQITVVSGRVKSVSVTGGRDQKRLRVIIAARKVGSRHRTTSCRGLINASFVGEPSQRVKAGQQISVPLLLRRAEGPCSPGDFNAGAYYASRGIWTLGYGRAETIRFEKGRAVTPATMLAELRRHLAFTVRENMPAEEGPLLNAILLGWRENLSDDDRRVFASSGAGHLLAVSGIHVMLLIGAAWWLLRSFRIRPRTCALLLVIFALGYAQLAGSRTPVLRAATMACLLLGGIALGRDSDGVNSLAVAALLIIGIWPRELFSIGFQMSFAAVLFIMGMVPALEDAWNSWRNLPTGLMTGQQDVLKIRAGSWLRLSFFTSLAASAATMPLVLNTFGIMNPWAPLVNIIAIPLAGLALASGLILLLLGLVMPALCPLPAALCWGALRLLKLILAGSTALPAASMNVNAPPAGIIILFYGLGGLALLLMHFRQKWRGRLAVGIALLSALACLSGFLPADAPRGLRVTLLDSGRGRSALVENTGGKCCMIWAGGNPRRIAALIRSERIAPPEILILPSGHAEACSAAPDIYDSGLVTNIAVPAGDAFREEYPELGTRGEEIRCGWTTDTCGFRIRALGAGEYHRSDGRIVARPLILDLSSPNGSVLLADMYGQQSLAAATRILSERHSRSDLLISSFAWRPARDSLQLVRSCGAEISLLKMNGYEYSEPSGKRIRETMRRSGVLPLTTGRYGALRATLFAGRIHVEGYIDQRWQTLVSRPVSVPSPARLSATAAESNP